MKKIAIYSIIVAAAGLLGSCASELNTSPQGGNVSDEQLAALVKKDPDAVLNPMMAGAVGYLHNGGSGTDGHGFKVWCLGLDMGGNDMVLTDLTNWFKNQYMLINYRAQSDGLVGRYWNSFYLVVYRANQILDLVAKAPENSKTKIYKAQALTLRALGYYYLMGLYQDDYLHGGKDKPGVPLYLQVQQDPLPRAASQEVYKQIFEDLKTAAGSFKAESYDDHKAQTDIDGSVANMLLARVALTIGEYATAAEAAGKVIDDGYTLMNEEQYTTTGFQKLTLPETIWGYKFSDATTLQNNAFASFTSIFNGAGYGPKQPIAIDERLYNQLPETDYRKKNFLAKDSTLTQSRSEYDLPKYANTKFATTDYHQDEIYMRLSEAYLLKAEAEARGGNDGAAAQTLYDLVSKRDTGYVLSTSTGEALLNEIFLQSRIELWGEGFEYLTNRRFNVGVDRKTGVTNHTAQVVIAPGKLFTLQIPLSDEIEHNPHITQNPL